MGACASVQEPSSRQHSVKLVQDPNGRTVKRPHLDDFELRRVVGRGAFGKVKVVVHKSSGAFYALKYIDKEVCIERNATANIIRERKILEALSHPLVCNLRYAFQDVEYLYLVTDLMLGGDLRFHLLRKTFTEDAVCHWIAEVVVALSYCHARGIVHRDVKPDNILLTGNGHIKLADFNISTQIKNGTLPHSRSGSLYYMAPEVHSGKHYDYAVDYWSLGAMFYECIYGQRAFDGKSNTDVAYSICNSVIVHYATSPSVSASCRTAIDSMLTKNPLERARSLLQIKQLDIFTTLDWSSLEVGASQPIFVPGDHKNFDASWELEEILLHDSPLEAKRPNARKRATREHSIDDDMHDLLEKYFSDFDHTKSKKADVVDIKIPAIPQMLAANQSSIDLTTASRCPEPDIPRLEVGQASDDEVDPVDATSKLKFGMFKTKGKKSVASQRGVIANKSCGRIKLPDESR